MLCQLAEKIGWSAAEARFGGLYAEEGALGHSDPVHGGATLLKHAFNESDETVVVPVVPLLQHFRGEEYFRHELP